MTDHESDAPLERYRRIAHNVCIPLILHLTAPAIARHDIRNDLLIILRHRYLLFLRDDIPVAIDKRLPRPVLCRHRFRQLPVIVELLDLHTVRVCDHNPLAVNDKGILPILHIRKLLDLALQIIQFQIGRKNTDKSPVPIHWEKDRGAGHSGVHRIVGFRDKRFPFLHRLYKPPPCRAVSQLTR